MNRVFKFSFMSVVYSFLYLPMIVLIVYSFNNSTYSLGWKGVTLSWYNELFSDFSLWEVALNSLTVAGISATFATALGSMSAVAFYRYSFRGKDFLYGLIYILIMAPEIVMGISFLILFVSLNIPLGFSTLLLAHITFCLPFVVVTVYSRMTGFDRNIIEAAKDLGASEFECFRLVILPLLMPGVVAGWLLSFTLSMDDVIISFFVTGPEFEILPLKIYSMVRLGVKPEINALCTILFGFTLAVVMIAQMLLKEKK
jgi:spermidine/putrescine transport system permease protein